MDIITTLRNRLECKINYTLLALLPNKFNMTTQGLVTSGENIRSKRATPALAIIQGVAAIGRMMIKGINALVYCFPFLLFSHIVRMSCHTDLFVEVTNITKGNNIWAHFTVTGCFPLQI